MVAGVSRPRKKPTLKAMLAATLRELFQIPHMHAKGMTAEHVISLVQFHHIEYHATDGSDEHWNLDPMLIAPHRKRTAEIDVPQIAKTKRITAKQEEFRRTMLTPRDQRPPKQSRWGSRKFEKRRKS